MSSANKFEIVDLGEMGSYFSSENPACSSCVDLLRRREEREGGERGRREGGEREERGRRESE